MAPNTKPTSNGTSRFTLPALELNFGSLTEGTNIPPPPLSPKLEPKPLSKIDENAEVGKEPKRKEPTGETHANGTAPIKPGPTIRTGGIKRPADDVPPSPAESSQTTRSHRGLRRLLSRSLLNNAYDEQGPSSTPAQAVSRPPSRTASIMAEEKKARRGSGWFRRLRANDHASDTKTTATPQSVPESKKPTGPPPPMIPELNKLEAHINTNLDAENLFKSIGRDS
ncbi:hypothetical protein GGR57DRAFT_339519 [Xylariaceae sp. FL1272]|nr:hypothetical protein GGR57DRAFT_339519 [Xylariaceae sp. FL1272]